MNKPWRGCLIEIVETVLLTVIIFFVVQHFVAQPYEIIGISMENTLYDGQMVLVDKISPVITDYRRGDVIVFSPPAGHQEDGKDVPFIKRVIGVPGDVVTVRDGNVFVNGAKLAGIIAVADTLKDIHADSVPSLLLLNKSDTPEAQPFRQKGHIVRVAFIRALFSVRSVHSTFVIRNSSFTQMGSRFP